MLLLIGLGVGPKDISIRAIDALKECDEILAEDYTSPIAKEYIDFIESAVGKKVRIIERSALEDDLKNTVASASKKNIAILVPGDPLVATTHHILIDAAQKAKINTKVFHSSSIFSAGIGESGLDIYRFGKTVTIPFWSEKYKPISFLDVIKKNLEQDAHTLILLDIDRKNNCTMSLGEAIGLLENAEKQRGYGIIKENTKILVLSDIGRDTQHIFYVDIKDAKATLADKLKGRMLCLMMPAKLNFAEEDAISSFQQS